MLLAEYDKAYMIKYPANKTYPLQMMHGLQFGLSQAQANYWIHRLLPVLREALAQLKLTPERDGE